MSMNELNHVLDSIGKKNGFVAAQDQWRETE
jgi:hypothetical protein